MIISYVQIYNSVVIQNNQKHTRIRIVNGNNSKVENSDQKTLEADDYKRSKY